MAQPGVKFIRVHGRIVPVKQKTGASAPVAKGKSLLSGTATGKLQAQTDEHNRKLGMTEKQVSKSRFAAGVGAATGLLGGMGLASAGIYKGVDIAVGTSKKRHLASGYGSSAMRSIKAHNNLVTGGLKKSGSMFAKHTGSVVIKKGRPLLGGALALGSTLASSALAIGGMALGTVAAGRAARNYFVNKNKKSRTGV